MESIHQGKIMKRVATRLWDSLSPREQALVAADNDSEISRWFAATVASETKAKYESPSYWMNEDASFKYPQIDPPTGWPA